MRGLFFTPHLPAPQATGEAISAFHVIHALIQRGHRIHVLIQHRPSPAELAAWPLRHLATLEILGDIPISHASPAPSPHRTARGMRRSLHARWCRYWGANPADALALADAVRRAQPDYIEVYGAPTLLAIAELPRSLPVIWHAGDDRCLHQLLLLAGQSRPALATSLKLLRCAAEMAAFQRSFAPLLDAAVVVSPADQRALRLFGSIAPVALAPNGVDTDYFHPVPAPVDPQTLLFWGRLDFHPNIQALHYFTRRVWPALHARHPDARFRVVGRAASDSLKLALAAIPGVDFLGPLDDLRPIALRSAAVVLPMTSGSGIKNKLLEAAALARPIIASPRALAGLRTDCHTPKPWLTARRPAHFIHAIQRLWADPQLAAELSLRARQWVTRHYTWPACALVHHQLIKSLATPRPALQGIAA